MKLDDELEQIYQNLSAIEFDGLSVLDALDSPDLDTYSSAAVAIHEMGKNLSDLVVQDNRFCGESVRMIYISGGGGSGFYPQFIAAPLVHQLLKHGSPKAATQWLTKILNTKKTTGKLMQAIWGVSVDESIQLTPSVKIVPIAELPESRYTKWITETYPLRTSLIATSLDSTPPDAVLVAHYDIEPVTGPPDEHPDKKPKAGENKIEMLNEITLALTAIGPRVAISAATWFTFDDPDFEDARMGRQTFFPSHEILPHWLSKSPDFNSQQAQEFLQGYLSLSGDTRTKLRLALSRLNLPNDAIKMVIALSKSLRHWKRCSATRGTQR